MNPLYAYQYSYRRVRDPTASEVAMSPSPACRHTHMHISYFPFLFIRIAVGRGPLFESPWLGCHNRRAWWPDATARQSSFSLAGYHSSPADASRWYIALFLVRARAILLEMSLKDEWVWHIHVYTFFLTNYESPICSTRLKTQAKKILIKDLVFLKNRIGLINCKGK